MAKFGINDILGVKSAASGTDKVSEYKEIWLSPYEVKPSESNFYSQEKIEELADSFLAVGQQQPTVLARIDGEFIIVSGHRRNLANIYNLERGHKEYQKIRYLYKDMTPAMLELSLLMGNACNRELTAWEKTQQAQRLKEALIRARDEDGLEIQGKLRDVIADIMNESSSGIARMDSINNNATPEIKNEFKKGNISMSATYEAARLPEEEQKEVARKASEKGRVKIKEISGKIEKKDPPFSVVSKLDTVLQQQTNNKKPLKDGSAGTNEEKSVKQREKDGKITPFNKIDWHAKILREWGTEHVNLNIVPKAVTDAVHRVSKLDTRKTDWTDIDWTVFCLKALMARADYVSEEDLYLLHDIMIRCWEEPEDC